MKTKEQVKEYVAELEKENDFFRRQLESPVLDWDNQEACKRLLRDNGNKRIALEWVLNED